MTFATTIVRISHQKASNLLGLGYQSIKNGGTFRTYHDFGYGGRYAVLYYSQDFGSWVIERLSKVA